MATFANSVDPEETVSNEPSHQDPHCLPFLYWFLTETAICISGRVKNQETQG